MKGTIKEDVNFIDHASGIWFPGGSKLAINWKKDSDITICPHDIIFKFSDVVGFLLSSLAAGPSFRSIL